jgi:hypothetical protein
MLVETNIFIGFFYGFLYESYAVSDTTSFFVSCKSSNSLKQTILLENKVKGVYTVHSANKLPHIEIRSSELSRTNSLETKTKAQFYSL